MNFIIYDIVLLVLFVISISIFLYTKRKNLKKEGLLFLYRTSWGIKLINYVGKKYKKTLKVLSYFSICLGYLLMAGMIYLSYYIVKIYLLQPDFVSTVKVPPIMPILPYIDKIVPGLPPFYFFYFIIILVIIAITHEFSHGIFMRRYDVKIKSTGFGFFPYFFPIFLAAFVEQDEESLKKAGRFEQMSILSAGTFANVLTAVFFFIIIWIFFSLAFAPAGVEFSTYPYSLVNASAITSINGIALNSLTYEKITELSNKSINKIKTENGDYIIKEDILNPQNEKLFNERGVMVLYDDAPAIKAGLKGVIREVDGVKIKSMDSLSAEIKKHSSGDTIKVITLFNDSSQEYEVILEENPESGMIWLGVGFEKYERSGVIGRVVAFLSSFKEPHIYYEAKFDGLCSFIYNLLWWIILISISVALVNMLPVGIFDGGRFFFLTMLALTGSQKKAKILFRFVTYLFLFILLLLMVFWAISFF